MTDPEVLVIGEALIDVVTTGPQEVEHVGGSPANVAYGLARLGVRTALLTAIGDDARGGLIRTHLESAGVNVLPASITPWRTSSATARLDATGSASYEFDIRWELVETDNLPAASAVHVGSISAFLEPGASAVLKILRGRVGNELISFDPNIRPALVGDPDAARERFHSLVGLADVVKLSDEDARWLFPDASIDDVISRVLDYGADLVAVTRGGEGSRLATDSDRIDVPSYRVEVVDTIGAGDTYMASLIASVRNLDVSAMAPEALHRVGERAAAASALTVSRAGAALPSAEELEAAYPADA
jgi:fructokinase